MELEEKYNGEIMETLFVFSFQNRSYGSLVQWPSPAAVVPRHPPPCGGGVCAFGGRSLRLLRPRSRALTPGARRGLTDELFRVFAQRCRGPFDFLFFVQSFPFGKVRTRVSGGRLPRRSRRRSRVRRAFVVTFLFLSVITETRFNSVCTRSVHSNSSTK